MGEPYGVLDSGEWSVWCRSCPWRGKPRDVMEADPLTLRAIRRNVEAEWRTHPCAQAAGAPANRPGVVGPEPPSNLREVA